MGNQSKRASVQHLCHSCPKGGGFAPCGDGQTYFTLVEQLVCSKSTFAYLEQERASSKTIHLIEADTYGKSCHSVNLVLLIGFCRRAALKLCDDLLEDPNLPGRERPGLNTFQASIIWSKRFLKRCCIRSLEGKPNPTSVRQQIDTRDI